MRPQPVSLARKIPFAVFCVWCVVTVVVAAHHEPWRDEADTWLLARDEDFAGLWHIARYVGAPILWLLVEVPFAKLGLSIGWQEVAHWPFAAAMCALLLFRSPFSLVERVALVFGYFFAYEYVVVARGYALTIACIFAVCALWPRRKNGSFLFALAIAALANATPAGLFFACSTGLALVVEFVVDVRNGSRPSARFIASMALGAAGVLLSMAQLFPSPPDAMMTAHAFDVATFARDFARGLIPGDHASVGLEIPAFIGALVLFALACVDAATRRAWAALAIGIVFALLTAYVVGCWYEGHLRNWGFFLVDALAIRWLASHTSSSASSASSSKVRRVVAIAYALSALSWVTTGVWFLTRDFSMRFSNAEAMGTWMHAQHVDDDCTIAAHRAANSEAVLPYLSPTTKLWYVASDVVGTHMAWNHRFWSTNRLLSARTLAERVDAKFPGWKDGAKRVVLLVTYPLPDDDVAAAHLKRVHVEDEPLMSANGERFWLYEHEDATSSQ